MTESTDSVDVALHVEVNICRAKTHLSRLLQRVAEGEEIIITRAGVPAARLVTVEPKKRNRLLDVDRGRVWVAEDFDAPLPDGLLAAFYGGEIPKLAKTRARKRK
jgi:prevent-host-death family protein